MKIKICGLNPARDVQLCIDLGINYLGFVFYEKSPRNVNTSDIKVLSNYDKKDSAYVAVTVNPTDEFIKKNLMGTFDYIQLHGKETKERVNEIKNMGFKIIKAIKIKDAQDIQKFREFETADRAGQAIRLLFQLLGGGGGLFHHVGVFLGHPVKLGHGDVDLFDAIALLAGCSVDLFQYVGYAGDVVYDILHRATRIAYQRGAVIHLGLRVFDQFLDIVGRVAAAASQFAHFLCHDGKATAMLASPRCFYRGVERQQVGLEGNAVHQRDDLANLVGGVGNIFHGGDHVRHHLTALFRDFGGRVGELVGFLC